MKFALACYGTRGDIEPSVAVGRELLRRGHEVRIAVPPELVDFVESVGLAAVAYGPNFTEYLDEEFVRDLWANFLRNFWTIRGPIKLLREAWAPVTRYWAEMSTTLKSLADGADLLFTGQIFQEPASNVAQYYDIPLATLHYFPIRSNGQLVRMVPVAVGSLRNDGDRVGVLAHDDESRRGAAPRTRPAEGNTPGAATDRRTSIAGNPSVRRVLLPRAGGRMGEMERANDRSSAR